MSETILLMGERNIYYRTPHSEGLVTSQQVIEFESIETSTEETHQILSSQDPAAEYERIVRDVLSPDLANSHLEQFREWTKNAIASGYKLIWETF